MFLFTLKFITHMKLIFVCGVRKGSGFILFSFRYLANPSSFNKNTVISPTVLDYLLYHKSYQSMRESVLAILIFFRSLFICDRSTQSWLISLHKSWYSAEQVLSPRYSSSRVAWIFLGFFYFFVKFNISWPIWKSVSGDFYWNSTEYGDWVGKNLNL